MLSKCPDELSENDELKGNELCESDSIPVKIKPYFFLITVGIA